MLQPFINVLNCLLEDDSVIVLNLSAFILDSNMLTSIGHQSLAWSSSMVKIQTKGCEEMDCSHDVPKVVDVKKIKNIIISQSLSNLSQLSQSLFVSLSDLCLSLTHLLLHLSILQGSLFEIHRG